MKLRLLFCIFLISVSVIVTSALTSTVAFATGNNSQNTDTVNTANNANAVNTAEETDFADEEPCSLQISVGQDNIVLRARQVFEIEWTPLRNVTKWNGRGVFREGETVRGLPYGMPNEANYVPLRTSFSEFLEEVSNRNSRFYRATATRHAIAPYYSLDCSSFVSWAWGEEKRLMTSSLHLISTSHGRDINKIQLGDALNNPGLHVVLVTYLSHDEDGKVTSIGLMELDPPQAKYTLYCDENGQPLYTVHRRYLNNDYTIIRYNKIENVVYLHDCFVPIDYDYCNQCIESSRDFNAPAFLMSKQGTRYLEIMKFIEKHGDTDTDDIDNKTYDYTLSRAMFIYLLSEFSNARIDSYEESVYIDVPIDEWYGKAIAWAADIGIIDAKSKLFEPRRNISNEEMAEILMSYIFWKNNHESTSAPMVFINGTPRR